MTLRSRDPDDTPLSDCIKIDPNNSRTAYEPRQMTDKSVHELAMHHYTVEEIASFFQVTAESVLKHHGDAFRRGKMFPEMKRRILYDQMVTAYLDPTINWADPENSSVANTAAKIMELGWKRFEGMGTKTEVHHTGKIAYDGVESAPEIIERPDDDPV